MHVVLAIVGIVMAQQSSGKAVAPRLNVRAERGFAGVQGDGWQHIALRLENSTGQPITGRATLYEMHSQLGARPRIVLPIEDRKVLHFYPYRPPETTQSGNYVITLDDDTGRPIPFDGGSQVMIGGQSTRAIRVDSGSSSSDTFQVAIWGDVSPYLRTLVGDWNPSIEESTRRSSAVGQWQRLIQSGRIIPEAITLDDGRVFPDSYIGLGNLQLLIARAVDFDQLQERQRRAIEEWVDCGGMILIIPANQQQLTGTFVQSLTGVTSRGEVTTDDDRHLPLAKNSGSAHRIVHFLTAPNLSRGIDVIASYESQPVVYSVPVGYGRVWMVGFDPDSHGGVRRYEPLWTTILNQAARIRLVDGTHPTELGLRDWSIEADSRALATLGERFGKSPSIEHLAALILGYLIVIGPINFLVLKRREARVWLIGTVPVLAVVFGGMVLCMGYLSHGVRAATNTMALAVVTPEGTRAFAAEQVAVYGATSAEYSVDFPRQLAIRPLGEYVANPDGSFEHASSFKLVTQDEHQWLRDWRLTFWQTRATTSVDCITLGGKLNAEQQLDGAVTVSNQTEIPFEEVLLGSDPPYRVGPMKAFESVLIPGSDDKAHLQGSFPSPTSLSSRDPNKASGARRARSADDLAGSTVAGSWPSDEAGALLRTAATKLAGYSGYKLNGLTGDWVFGLTRQPIHAVRSPDTRRQYIATVYMWPVNLRSQPAPSAKPSTSSN